MFNESYGRSRWIAALGAAALSSFAQADGGGARLVDMHGSVLVARDSSIASVDEGARVASGSHIITTDNATVVVVFDDGCRASVGPDRRFVVDRQVACSKALSSKEKGAEESPS